MLSLLLRVGWFVLIAFTLWQATTPKPVEVSMQVNDKVLHIFAFFVLSAWGCFAWLTTKARTSVVCGLVVLGIVIEVAQHFVPGRFASFADFVGDVVGIGAGFALIVWILPKLLPSVYQFFVRLVHA